MLNIADSAELDCVRAQIDVLLDGFGHFYDMAKIVGFFTHFFKFQDLLFVIFPSYTLGKIFFTQSIRCLIYKKMGLKITLRRFESL